MAMANQLCIKSPKIGGNKQAECCDCCKRGRRMAKETRSCVTSDTGLCKESFSTCCEELKAKLPPTQAPKVKKTCADIQCDKVKTSGCVEGSEGPQCICKTGFIAMNDGITCSDIDECMTGNNKCPDSCVNTIGSYSCECAAGLMRVDNKCVEAKECEKGYVKENNTCFDFDECTTKKHRCPDNSFCLNTRGSYRCLQHCRSPNLQVNQQTGSCEDVNECETGAHQCNEYFQCVNTVGRYDCKRVRCYEGYKLVKEYCEDIDECAEQPDRCGEKGSCRNVAGRHYCDCQTGYEMNEATGKCEDINECKLDRAYCQHECINTEGSYRCACPTGYEVRGNFCYDKNECRQSPCASNEFCYNNFGSYACINQSCPNKYYTESSIHAGSPNSCRKINCNQNKECNSLPLESLKRVGYKFLKDVPVRAFVFTYTTGFNRRFYDVRSKIASGNKDGIFRIHYVSNNEIQIINQVDIVGPKSFHFVLQTDIYTLRRGVLTWRYEYHFYVYVAAHKFG